MNIEALKRKKDEDAQMTGAIRPNPVYCMTCLFSHGDPPFADEPDKANCEMYAQRFKPREVLFDGAECIYYERKGNEQI